MARACRDEAECADVADRGEAGEAGCRRAGGLPQLRPRAVARARHGAGARRVPALPYDPRAQWRLWARGAASLRGGLAPPLCRREPAAPARGRGLWRRAAELALRRRVDAPERGLSAPC